MQSTYINEHYCIEKSTNEPYLLHVNYSELLATHRVSLKIIETLESQNKWGFRVKNERAPLF